MQNLHCRYCQFHTRHNNANWIVIKFKLLPLRKYITRKEGEMGEIYAMKYALAACLIQQGKGITQIFTL